MKNYLVIAALFFPLIANAQEEKKPPPAKKEPLKIECPETASTSLLLTIDTEQNTAQVVSRDSMGNQEEYITESLKVTAERYIVSYRGPMATTWVYEINIDRTDGSYYLSDTKKKTPAKSMPDKPCHKIAPKKTMF